MPQMIWPKVQAMCPIIRSLKNQMRRNLRRIALKHGLNVSMLKSKDRSEYIVKARQEFIYQSIKLGASRTEVGQVINRDHSTVSHNYYEYIKHRADEKNEEEK